MAYDTARLKEQALTAIQKHNLYFIEDVIAYLPCHKTTFYEHFPNESNNRKEIDRNLEQNRITAKVALRSKWYESDNPTLQMGLMKLLSTDTELRKLSMQAIDHTSGGEQIKSNVEEMLTALRNHYEN